MKWEGKTVRTESDRPVHVKEFIAAGGQGEAYWAVDIRSGEKGVVKAFHKKFANGETTQRLRFLLKRELRSLCPALWAPTEIFCSGDLVGHYAPKAPGNSLEELLATPTFNFVEGLELGIALCHALSELHQEGIAHGDIQSSNFFVERKGSVLHLHVIDFDNYQATRVPDPPCVGQEMYMAPELREALAHHRTAIPSIETDRYALGVQLHEIILLLHPATGSDNTADDFHRAMCQGQWLRDPADSGRPSGDVGGYPTEILNTSLARLFRLSLNLDPAERPSADEWECGLSKAFTSVFSCPRPDCGGPCIPEVGKDICAYCGRPFPSLALCSTDGTKIPLVCGAVVVGRSDLSGSMKVSERHAILRRIGPETWLESVGANGTQRWSGSRWVPLPNRERVLVHRGDRLRFADVEVYLDYLD